MARTRPQPPSRPRPTANLPTPGYALLSVAPSAAYRERAFTAGVGPRDTWGDYADRCLRYDVYWAHYEGTIYRKLHQWADALQIDHGLYEHIRSILSPVYRIVEFWAAHIYGSPRQSKAGQSGGLPTCCGLPIAVGDGGHKADASTATALVSCIDRVLRDSSWAVNKDIYPRFGAALGDVGLMVVDDAARQKVYIRVVHPRILYSVDRDPFGNVKGYVILEKREDPRQALEPGDTVAHVVYAEIAERSGESVQYTTLLDGEPFDWREYPEGTPDSAMIGPSWTEDYGFIPMVHVQNRNMGLGWGWGELQGSSGKIYELDDIASKADDHVRKTVDPEWFVPGAAPGDVDIEIDDEDGSAEGGRGNYRDDASGGRDNKKLLFGPEGSKPSPLVADLNLADVTAHLKYVEASIIRDHPELMAEDVSPDASGEARRVAREKVEAQVVQRRANYDDGLKRVVQMAISIGASREYPGFEAFDDESYARGELDFSVGDRPVFAVSEDDRLARSKAMADVIKTLTDAGTPFEFAAKLAGVEDGMVAEIVRAKEDEDRKAVEADRAMQAAYAAATPAIRPDGSADQGEGPAPDPDEEPDPEA